MYSESVRIHKDHTEVLIETTIFFLAVFSLFGQCWNTITEAAFTGKSSFRWIHIILDKKRKSSKKLFNTNYEQKSWWDKIWFYRKELTAGHGDLCGIEIGSYLLIEKNIVSSETVGASLDISGNRSEHDKGYYNILCCRQTPNSHNNFNILSSGLKWNYI